MNVIRASQMLIVAFVGSVTLWYFVTPYIVHPHPGIVQDILDRSQLLTLPNEKDGIAVENWTKWQVYVRQSPEDDTPVVVYAQTSDTVAFQNKAVINMEWRPEYKIHVSQYQENQNKLSASIEVPSEYPLLGFSNWGIYKHFETHVVSDKTIRIVPRFLFGLSHEAIESIYGDKSGQEDIVSRLPIVGVFTNSPNYDRIIIQTYMNIVTLSVIFLLWANNPPETLVKSQAK